MIDKDLAPVYGAMVQTSYVPVIRKTIILLLMQDINRMQVGMKLNDVQFLEMLHTDNAKKALRICLDSLVARRETIIHEILMQYSINTKTMTDFYHREFDKHFLREIEHVWGLVYQGQYAALDHIVADGVIH